MSKFDPHFANQLRHIGNSEAYSQQSGKQNYWVFLHNYHCDTNSDLREDVKPKLMLSESCKSWETGTGCGEFVNHTPAPSLCSHIGILTEWPATWNRMCNQLLLVQIGRKWCIQKRYLCVELDSKCRIWSTMAGQVSLGQLPRALLFWDVLCLP